MGDGRVSPAPSPRHQRILTNLLLLLAPAIRAAGLGVLLPAPLEVLLSGGGERVKRQPDLVYVAAANASIVGSKRVEGTPDLLVEILSERTRQADLVTKRAEYERFGVPEYWVVDPVSEALLIFRRSERRLMKVLELRAENHDVARSPLFPGIRLEVRSIFE
jgi:Uma2 family endonuclease